jgi:hypothetical protein
MSDPGGGGKRPAGGDLVIPLAAAAFAVYYLTTVWALPWEAKASGIFLGSALLALVALFLVLTAVSIWRGRASLAMWRLVEPRRFQGQRLGLVALMIAFIAAIPYLGFTLAVFAFLIAAMLLLGVKSWPRLLAVSAGTSLAGYLLFIALLDTPFPRGPVESLLGLLF